MKKFFVTGTDTEVGKTYVTAGCLQAASAMHLTTLGLKPVASGCEKTSEGLRNADALALQAASTCRLAYELINPFAFEKPIAPHIAAERQGEILSCERLTEVCSATLQQDVDFLLVEGVGGFRVPLNQRETMADWVKILNIPVILVVGIRLGCINHALLTLEAILRDGLIFAGWIANCVDPSMLYQEKGIDYLSLAMPNPPLAILPFQAKKMANETQSTQIFSEIVKKLL